MYDDHAEYYARMYADTPAQIRGVNHRARCRLRHIRGFSSDWVRTHVHWHRVQLTFCMFSARCSVPRLLPCAETISDYMSEFHDVHMCSMLKKVHNTSLSNVARDPRVHTLVFSGRHGAPHPRSSRCKDHMPPRRRCLICAIWHLQTCSLPEITGGSLKFHAPADPTAARPTPCELLHLILHNAVLHHLCVRRRSLYSECDCVGHTRSSDRGVSPFPIAVARPLLKWLEATLPKR